MHIVYHRLSEVAEPHFGITTLKMQGKAKPPEREKAKNTGIRAFLGNIIKT